MECSLTASSPFSNLRLKFTPKEDTSLEVKFFQENGELIKSVTLTPEQLDGVRVSPEGLEGIEEVEKVKKVLLKYQLLPKPNGNSNTNPYAPSPIVTKNPFTRSSSGLRTALPENHPYYQKHPKWCALIGSGGCSFNDHSKMKEYRVKMGIPHAESGLGKFESKEIRELEKVIEECQSCSCEVGKIKAERLLRHCYQLFFHPVRDVLGTIRSPLKIFMLHQQKFRNEMQQVLGNRITSDENNLMNQIISNMDKKREEREKKRDELLDKYADQETLIHSLFQKGERLISEAEQELLDEVNNYLQKVKDYFRIIFQYCPDLQSNYEGLIEMNQYQSLDEIPDMVPVDKIYIPSYFSLLKRLVAGSLPVLQTEKVSESVWKRFQSTCLEFQQAMKKPDHFRESVTPLIKLFTPIEAILEWPHEFDLVEDEWDAIRIQLYFLIAITSTELGRLIHPKYLTLSVADKELAEKKVEGSDKQEALRILYHYRIPWKSLATIGNFCDSSNKEVHSIVRSALPDIFSELSHIKQAIEDLIEFEIGTSNQKPSTYPCYPMIDMLGGYSDCERNVKTVLDKLRPWINARLTTEVLSKRKFRYATLRTVQILGEICKNLDRVGFLSEDPLWDVLEELRDLLSHPERISISKKVNSLLEGSDLTLLSKIRESFPILHDYFQELKRELQKKKNVGWDELKELQDRNKKETFFCVDGLFDFKTFLVGGLLSKERNELKAMSQSGKANQWREEIEKIRNDFLSGNFEEKDEKVKRLPLKKKQKQDLLEAMKVLTSDKNLKESQKTGETVDECRQRQKNKICTILSFKLEQDAGPLIEEVQKDGVKGDLDFRLLQLGITDPEDVKKWKEAEQKCKRAKNQPQREDNTPKPPITERALLRVATIRSKIEELDFLPEEFEQFSKDPFLHYVCQYMLSNFRYHATLLEDDLRTIGNLFPRFYLQIFEIREKLLSTIGEGNAILHVHEATEKSTLTDYGRVLKLYAEACQMLRNPPSQSSLSSSLIEQLQDIEHLLQRISLPAIPEENENIPLLTLEELESSFTTLQFLTQQSIANVWDAIDFYDQLNQAGALFWEDQRFQEIALQVEELIAYLFQEDISIPYQDKTYRLCRTKGEGACALHALLGEIVNGVVQFRGTSQEAKNLFVEHFMRVIQQEDQVVKKIFLSLMQDHLNGRDPLFNSLREKWSKIKTDPWPDYALEEGKIWMKAIQDKTSPIVKDFGRKLKERELQKVYDKISNDPSLITTYVNEEPDKFLAHLDSDTKKEVEEIRKTRKKSLQHWDKTIEQFILNEEVIQFYSEIMRLPGFFLNTQEIELAAQLFKINVTVFAGEKENIALATEYPGGSSEDAPVVIYHRGAHFSRCL